MSEIYRTKIPAVWNVNNNKQKYTYVFINSPSLIEETVRTQSEQAKFKRGKLKSNHSNERTASGGSKIYVFK